jgi:hypothetical protein
VFCNPQSANLFGHTGRKITFKKSGTADRIPDFICRKKTKPRLLTYFVHKGREPRFRKVSCSTAKRKAVLSPKSSMPFMA